MRITHPHRWMMSATLLGWWGFVALEMVRAMRRDPGPTGLPGDMRYLHNSPGDLQTFLQMSLVELVVVMAMLRPWSYDRSWGRALGALMLLVPWTLLTLLMLVHSGTVMLWHAAWLVGLVAGTVCLALRGFARRQPAGATEFPTPGDSTAFQQP